MYMCVCMCVRACVRVCVCVDYFSIKTLNSSKLSIWGFCGKQSFRNEFIYMYFVVSYTNV